MRKRLLLLYYLLMFGNVLWIVCSCSGDDAYRIPSWRSWSATARSYGGPNSTQASLDKPNRIVENA